MNLTSPFLSTPFSKFSFSLNFISFVLFQSTFQFFYVLTSVNLFLVIFQSLVMCLETFTIKIFIQLCIFFYRLQGFFSFF